MMLLAGPTTAHDLLFGGAAADPAAGLALDFGGQLNGNLPAKIGEEARKAVARDLADAAVGLTSARPHRTRWPRDGRGTPSSWAAGRRTRDLPGTRRNRGAGPAPHLARGPPVRRRPPRGRSTDPGPLTSLSLRSTPPRRSLRPSPPVGPPNLQLGTGARHGNPGPRRRAPRPTQQGVRPAAGARLRGGPAAGVTPDAKPMPG